MEEFLRNWWICIDLAKKDLGNWWFDFNSFFLCTFCRFVQEAERCSGRVLRRRPSVEIPIGRRKLTFASINQQSMSEWMKCVVCLQDIDYEGFKLFMDTYLEVEVQEELCKRLFLSFVKKTPTKTISNVTDCKVIKVAAPSFKTRIYSTVSVIINIFCYFYFLKIIDRFLTVFWKLLIDMNLVEKKNNPTKP